MHELDEILLHVPGEEVLIGQDEQDFPFKRRKISLVPALFVCAQLEEANRKRFRYKEIYFNWFCTITMRILKACEKNAGCGSQFFRVDHALRA